MSVEVDINMDIDNEVKPNELVEHYKIVALTLHQCHKAKARRNKYIATSYNIFTILITSITGSASLSLLFEEYKRLKVLNVILSYMVVALGTMYRYYTPDKRKEQHKVASEDYLRLYYRIIETIIFDEISVEWIKGINHRLEELRENSPYIDNEIYDKIKLSCKSNTFKCHKKMQKT